MKTIVIGLAAGVLGMVLWQAGSHLYADHVLVDLLRADILRRQAVTQNGAKP